MLFVAFNGWRDLFVPRKDVISVLTPFEPSNDGRELSVPVFASRLKSVMNWIFFQRRSNLLVPCSLVRLPQSFLSIFFKLQTLRRKTFRKDVTSVLTLFVAFNGWRDLFVPCKGVISVLTPFEPSNDGRELSVSVFASRLKSVMNWIFFSAAKQSPCSMLLSEIATKFSINFHLSYKPCAGKLFAKAWAVCLRPLSRIVMDVSCLFPSLRAA